MITELIRHNFQEIFHVASQPKSTPLSLVANPSGTHVYDSSRGWGRFWQWLECLQPQVAQQTKIKHALQLTHEQFHKQLAHLELDLIAYYEYLDKIADDYAVNEGELFKVRHNITQWNRSTRPFIKTIKRLQNPGLVSFLHSCFSKDFQKSDLSSFFTSKEEEKFAISQRIIDLEGLTAGPLPLRTFKKVFHAKPLDSIDKKALDQWVHQINSLPTSSVRMIHEGLNILATYYLKKDDFKKNRKIDLAILEVLIEDRGCSVFHKEDPIHLKWRGQLKKGSQITFNSLPIILGEEFPSSSPTTDLNRVFEVEGKKECVALISHNRAVITMKFVRNFIKSNVEIPPVQILEVSNDGRMALVEKLTPLNGFKWKTFEPEIHKDDLPILNSIIHLIQWLITNNFTPTNLSPAYLMFDRLHRIKTLKPMQNAPFDFNVLEKFVFYSANNNINIYRYLMEKSGLSSHKTAAYYREMFVNALQGDGKEDIPAADDLAGIYKIGDFKVVQRGTDLAKEAINLLHNLYPEIKKLLPQLEQKKLMQEISQAIIDYHQLTLAASFIWPSLSYLIIEGFQNGLTTQQ